jgi:hypothetical protein
VDLKLASNMPIDRGNPMPRETAEEFARQMSNRLLTNHPEELAKFIRARDRETSEEMRERAQKYLEKHGTGINSIAELNEALGFTVPIDLPADNNLCSRCKGVGYFTTFSEPAWGDVRETCPDCHGTGKVGE